MRVLRGVVSSRHGLASHYLPEVHRHIIERTGMPRIYPGTLNLTLSEIYVVVADAVIEAHEYQHNERLKLQKCRALGLKMFIMRPAPHEFPGREGANVLELLSEHSLRKRFGLNDGDVVEVEVEGDADWWAQPESSEMPRPGH